MMSSSSVLKDSHTILKEYGMDLDLVKEGDIVGVGLDAGSGGGATGDLHFYINGIDQVWCNAQKLHGTLEQTFSQK